MGEIIRPYTADDRNAVEYFRRQTFDEGNESLSIEKFDPENFNGTIWLAFVDDVLVSLSAAEVSHYTGETDVIRKCRYHILRAHRHGRFGFKFLKLMVPWCQDNGYRLLYWTHDVQNKALNALYQGKRTYAGTTDNHWFRDWPYDLVNLERQMLFKTGRMLQFVYSIKIDDSFQWQPRAGDHMYYYDHDGRVVNWDDIKATAIAARDLGD